VHDPSDVNPIVKIRGRGSTFAEDPNTNHIRITMITIRRPKGKS